MNRRQLLQALSLATLFAASGGSRAQVEKPIKIVVPYSAGGATDFMARLLATAMGKTLKRTVIVENKPGATALIGTRAVQMSPPDGDTLLFHNEGLSLIPLLRRDAGYEPLKDFAPVSTTSYASNLLVVHKSVPANSLAEFIAWAKKQPAGVEAANAGIGSSGHLQTVWFAQLAGINVLHVPYKGSAETAQALITGQVKMQLTAPTDVLISQAKAGTVRFLGIGADKRVAYAPDIPTITETVPGFVSRGWYGLLVTAGTPPEAIARLNHAVVEAMRDPRIRERFQSIYQEPESSTPAEMAEAIRRGSQRFAKMIVDAGVPVQ